MGGETNFSSHLELEVGKSRYFFLDEAFFFAAGFPAFFAGFASALIEASGGIEGNWEVK